MSIPEPLQALTTIRDFVRWGSSEFLRNELTFGHGFASAFDEAISAMRDDGRYDDIVARHTQGLALLPSKR